MKTSRTLQVTSLFLTLIGLSLSPHAHARGGGHHHAHSERAPARSKARAPSRRATPPPARQAAGSGASRREVTTVSSAARSGSSRSLKRREVRSSRRVQRRVERRVKRRVSRGRTHRARHSHRPHRPFRAIPIARPAARPHLHSHHHTRSCGHNRVSIFNELYNDPVYFGVNEDFSDEERRIERGLQSGRLTPREARRLKDMLWDAQDLEDEALHDGLLTHREEADLYWAERELNREIRWELNDFERW